MENPQNALYQYRPLPSPDCIRILTLESGQDSDPLEGSLEVVPIQASGDYEALSYVWGPGDDNCSIMLREDGSSKGRLRLSGGSIFAALRRLRFGHKSRRIWADQCCINQMDLSERGHQVHFMDAIYRNATHVLVWLGMDEEKKAPHAFQLIHELDSFLSDDSKQIIQPGNLENHVKDNRNALQALTDRAWFKRGWIVQEIGTAAPATMFWGEAEIAWDILAEVCVSLKGYHHLRKTLGIATSDISFLFRRFIEPDENTHHANRFNFVYELQRARHLRFSDDRDRVFAFLGHFSVQSTHPLSCGPLSFEADYTKTLEQTYTDVAVRILRTHPVATCILLGAVQHHRHSLPRTGMEVTTSERNDESAQDKEHLPSWVPDWRWSEAIILAEPICPHRAHGKSVVHLDILEEDRMRLRIHGLEIDVVESCSRPMLAEDIYRKKTSDQTRTLIEWLWHELCGREGFNLEDQYLGGQSAFFAFTQTLSNGCVQAAGHGCRLYDEIVDREWLNKAARYIVETLGVHGNLSADIVEAAEGAQGESDHEKWSRWATSASENRVFATTKSGRYVLGPSTLEAGDLVCVLFGCKVPFCLRPISGHYVLVGECYVHGLMKGEAMDMFTREEVLEKIFDIV